MPQWSNVSNIQPTAYDCGYCGAYVGSNEGYIGLFGCYTYIYICPNCKRPTYINEQGHKVPGTPYGNPVEHISSNEVQSLYEEVRQCMSINAHTAAVLCCRKLLMNIAVSKGAREGLRFIQYVEFLSDQGFIPPDAREWVDHIRQKGNEATHEITIMSRFDAEELVNFVEMLRKLVYEFPTKIRASDRSSGRVH
jgi:hypothetical protein